MPMTLRSCVNDSPTTEAIFLSLRASQERKKGFPLSGIWLLAVVVIVLLVLDCCSTSTRNNNLGISFISIVDLVFVVGEKPP